MRVCQFRHDGNLICNAAAARRPPCQEEHFYFTAMSQTVKPPSPPRHVELYPSFAVIVIFAFSTFDTGHPFSAASAYF